CERCRVTTHIERTAWATATSRNPRQHPQSIGRPAPPSYALSNRFFLRFLHFSFGKVTPIADIGSPGLRALRTIGAKGDTHSISYTQAVWHDFDGIYMDLGDVSAKYRLG